VGNKDIAISITNYVQYDHKILKLFTPHIKKSHRKNNI